jgi:hypothetical protein
MHAWIPGWSYGALASLELAETARRRSLSPRDRYVECAMVAVRR